MNLLGNFDIDWRFTNFLLISPFCPVTNCLLVKLFIVILLLRNTTA